MQPNPLRKKLADGFATYGMWVTLDCPNVTEAAVEAGIDWVVIEMEHGHLGWGDVIEHLRVTSGTDTAAIVRIADQSRENIQRALDLGADGLIVPMIQDARQLERCFELGRYPPRGVRGVAGERCVRWGLQSEEYLNRANEETLVIPLLESRAAVESIDDILAVPGLEIIFFGPADMSASYGHLGQWEGGDVARILRNVRDQAAAAGIASGILARDHSELGQRKEQGFQLIGLGSDVGLMLRSLSDSLARAGKR